MKQSNQEAQTRNAPCALVLQAEYDDHHKSIRGAASQHLILQLAKTHRVAVKTVGNGVLVGKIINETFCTIREPIRLLCVIAHGDSDGIRFGELDGSDNALDWRTSDLKREDFMRLHQDASIVLIACKTGPGFAQKLADCSKRKVLAPKNPMYIPNQIEELANTELMI